MFPLVLRLLIEILPLQFFAEASFQLSMWLPSVVGAKQSMYVSLITAPTLCNSEHAPPQYHVVRRLNDDSILLSYLCQQADIGHSAVYSCTVGEEADKREKKRIVFFIIHVSTSQKRPKGHSRRAGF